jgi:hypothetical protein
MFLESHHQSTVERKSTPSTGRLLEIKPAPLKNGIVGWYKVIGGTE